MINRRSFLNKLGIGIGAALLIPKEFFSKETEKVNSISEEIEHPEPFVYEIKKDIKYWILEADNTTNGNVRHIFDLSHIPRNTKINLIRVKVLSGNISSQKHQLIEINKFPVVTHSYINGYPYLSAINDIPYTFTPFIGSKLEVTVLPKTKVQYYLFK